MKILLINFNYLGDVLLTTPAIKALREAYPNALLVSLVGKNAKEVLLNNPYLDKIILREKGTKFFLNLLKTIKEYKFDLAILFQDTLESALLTWLAKIPQRIGYKKEGGQFFLTTSIKKNTPEHKHAVISHLSLISKLGINLEKCSKKMEIFLDKEDIENAEDLLKKENINFKSKLIALCPFTNRESKQWSLESFAAIGDFLIQKYNAQVIIVGHSKDIPSSEKILKLMKEKGINLVGKTTIKELAYIFEKCQLVITGDSFPMHLATTIEHLTVISLFGSTDPEEVAPYENKHITFYKKLKCSPCKKNKCKYKTNKCMEEITVDEMKKSIFNILK